MVANLTSRVPDKVLVQPLLGREGSAATMAEEGHGGRVKGVMDGSIIKIRLLSSYYCAICEEHSLVMNAVLFLSK